MQTTSRDAEKFDQGKLRYDLLPPDALEAVTAIFTMGQAKYGDRNWEQGMDWNRAFAAAQRHMWAWQAGEDMDQESGLPHLAHAAVNMLFIIAWQSRDVGIDTRSV